MKIFFLSRKIILAPVLLSLVFLMTSCEPEGDPEDQKITLIGNEAYIKALGTLPADFADIKGEGSFCFDSKVSYIHPDKSDTIYFKDSCYSVNIAQGKFDKNITLKFNVPASSEVTLYSPSNLSLSFQIISKIGMTEGYELVKDYRFLGELVDVGMLNNQGVTSIKFELDSTFERVVSTSNYSFEDCVTLISQGIVDKGNTSDYSTTITSFCRKTNGRYDAVNCALSLLNNVDFSVSEALDECRVEYAP